MGWAVKTEGAWETTVQPDLPFGRSWIGTGAGAKLAFAFHGNELAVVPVCAAEPCTGALQVAVDDRPPITVRPGDRGGSAGSAVTVAGGLTDGPHQALIEVTEAPAGIAALTVRRSGPIWPRWLAGGLATLVLLVLLARNVIRVARARRAAGPKDSGADGSQTPPASGSEVA